MTWLLAAATIAAVLASPAAGSPQAKKDMTGCTWAPYGTVCLHVWGPGSFLQGVGVQRVKGSWDMICNYQAKVVVFQPGGPTLYWDSPYRNNCTPGSAWMFVYPYRRVKSGSTLCAAWFEGGARQGGWPCARIT